MSAAGSSSVRMLPVLLQLWHVQVNIMQRLRLSARLSQVRLKCALNPAPAYEYFTRGTTNGKSFGQEDFVFLRGGCFVRFSSDAHDAPECIEAATFGQSRPVTSKLSISPPPTTHRVRIALSSRPHALTATLHPHPEGPVATVRKTTSHGKEQIARGSYLPDYAEFGSCRRSRSGARRRPRSLRSSASSHASGMDKSGGAAPCIPEHLRAGPAAVHLNSEIKRGVVPVEDTCFLVEAVHHEFYRSGREAARTRFLTRFRPLLRRSAPIEQQMNRLGGSILQAGIHQKPAIARDIVLLSVDAGHSVRLKQCLGCPLHEGSAL